MALRPSKLLDPQGARDAALRLLGRREHSAQELKAKLQGRGLDDQIAKDLVASLGSAGWQSDARYVEVLVRSRITQGHGPVRIEAELEAAGISQSAAREALDAAETDWHELAAQVRARRFANAAVTLADKQKQYRFLAGRGFSAEQIRSALKSVVADDAD